MIIFTIIMLIFLVFYGCSEEKPLKTVKDYAFTLNDLPEGYGIYNEFYDDKIGNISDDFLYEELYSAYFWNNLSSGLNTTEPLYPPISIFIYKLADINEANRFHNEFMKMNQSDNLIKDITPENVEPIGDESKYILYQVENFMMTSDNATFSQLGFRVKNIYVVILIFGSIDMEIDYYTFTYNLAEIVYNKIKEDI